MHPLRPDLLCPLRAMGDMHGDRYQNGRYSGYLSLMPGRLGLYSWCLGRFGLEMDVMRGFGVGGGLVVSSKIKIGD